MTLICINDFKVETTVAGRLVLICGGEGMATELVFSVSSADPNDPTAKRQRAIMDLIVNSVQECMKQPSNLDIMNKLDEISSSIPPIHVWTEDKT